MFRCFIAAAINSRIAIATILQIDRCYFMSNNEILNFGFKKVRFLEIPKNDLSNFLSRLTMSFRKFYYA